MSVSSGARGGNRSIDRSDTESWTKRSRDAAEREPVPLTGAGLKVVFGGVAAVDGVDFRLDPGEILGLIGPNGAGKTTCVNAITGFQPLTSGSVSLGSVRISDMPARRVAHAGLARTFQDGRLFGSLTVAENIEVGGLGVGLPRREVRRMAAELLAWADLSAQADRAAGALPYGARRIVGVLRALACAPRFVFLDEPAAGIAEEETEGLLQLLRSIPGRFHCGMLIIEHDMSLIMRLCGRIQVLDYGQTLAVGSPDVIRTNRQVIEAYLGTRDTELRHELLEGADDA